MDERDELTRAYIEEIAELSELCADMVEDTRAAMDMCRARFEDMARQAGIVVEQQRRLAAAVERNHREAEDLVTGLEQRLRTARAIECRRATPAWVAWWIALATIGGMWLGGIVHQCF